MITVYVQCNLVLLFFLQDKDKNKQTPDSIVAFDFDSFDPKPVFLVLLYKCLSITLRTTEESNLVVNEKNLKPCNFYFRDAIHFTVHLRQAKTDKNLIWVRLNALESSQYQMNISAFLHQLDVLMRRICLRYFESILYKYKALCDCCLDKCADMQFGPGDDLDWHTIVDHSANAPLDCRRFPSSDVSYACREKRTFWFKGSPREANGSYYVRNDSQMYSDTEYLTRNDPKD